VNFDTAAGSPYDNAAAYETSAAPPARSAGPRATADPRVEVSEVDQTIDDVPYEVAAVAAKLRNVARVGGERVREMDHFVESVRTPVVELRTTDGGGTKLAARRALEAELRRLAVDARGPNVVDVGGHPCVFVCDAAPPARAVAAARCFWRVLREALYVAGSLESPTAPAPFVALYHMASVRADEFVCARDASDGRLYVNALPFQQADRCGADGAAVAADAWPEVLAYWASRVAAADGRPGLYSAAARHRLAERLFDLSGAAPGMEVWAADPGAAEREKRRAAIPPVDGELLVAPE